MTSHYQKEHSQQQSSSLSASEQQDDDQLPPTPPPTKEHTKSTKKPIVIVSNSTCDPNLFDPFRKYARNRKKESEADSSNMKHDYRRENVAQDTSKNSARHGLDCKKAYLFIYNLSMFVVFLMVYMILLIKGLTGTMDDDSVKGAAFIIKLLTYTQLLEAIHPMLGLVPGGPFMPLLQVVGRLVVNGFLTDPTIRINSAPYAHYLFIVWSSIEIFRYSFYALRVFKIDIYPLTYGRYTLFMPLYPLGGLCESKVVFATIEHYQKTGAYSISLPNAANVSFNLPIFLKFYVYVLLWPSILHLMRYMWSQRCKQLKKQKVD